ncbi:hypothetical protein B1B04_24825 [Lysinibacillus sp. KCTC 33748]|uniref:discoidin domain-containing protein n=1 Tax=unclassified Lysinibacillus TaxID=2636778 RepID=UPI0009A7A2FF|nr:MULTISPECIES: discoidin domain-containing protein [unclassified Lysinibacillus]OXS65766.1 hypothetical protein B1B04_24825 [Lysinibacillus sp. KCTC 33748]SKC19238.1 F5/8 type C domain-containing protein [Lysinibacillus sp. AC-3]
MKETYVIELFDYFSNNGATITEIELFYGSKKVNYRGLDAYDTVTKGVPHYWNDTSYWGFDRLSNNNKIYTNNSTGGASSTLFIYSLNSTAGQGNWARFSIETDDVITKMVICLGSPEGRIPKEVTIFRVNGKYSSTLLNSRLTDGLKEIEKLNLNNNILAPIDFEVKVNEFGFSIYSDITNEYYSLSDNTLVHLPDNSPKNMILHGIKQGKEIQLDVPFDKHRYFNDTPVANVSGKVFTHDIDKINTLNIKELRENNSFEPIYTWYETNMTANNVPSPLVASASSINGSLYEPFRAFDGITADGTTYNTWATASNQHLESWVKIDFGAEKEVNCVALSARRIENIDQMPKTFTIEGSNDNTQWTELGNFSKDDWQAITTYTFSLKNGSYRYLRIINHTTNGSNVASWCEIKYGYKREVK